MKKYCTLAGAERTKRSIASQLAIPLPGPFDDFLIDADAATLQVSLGSSTTEARTAVAFMMTGVSVAGGEGVEASVVTGTSDGEGVDVLALRGAMSFRERRENL